MADARRLQIESLEARTHLAWSPYAQLVGQDLAAIDYPKITGAGSVVAVIDTGIDYTHPALGGGFGKQYKVIGGYDFYDNDSDPMDTDGHGTAVAGVIAANPYTTGGITYQGVAPGAKLVALRVGTASRLPDVNIEAALQWIITAVEKGTYAINVVNLSLGSGNYTDARIDRFSDEFARLRELGVFVVAASGNSNDARSGPIDQDGIAAPAADPNVFAVGAVDANDVISTWTQRGDELDLLAPGVNIVMPGLNGTYLTESGTSFASPYVAGTAALLYQVDPKMGPGDVGSVLMSSGIVNRDGDKEAGDTTGLLFSRLDIHDAIAIAARRVGRTSTLELGRSFATALDSQGVLHAAFYDTKTGRLLYATRNTRGLWSAAYIVDRSADVGVQASIAVDTAGHVGIAYFDLTNTALKYAWFNSNLRWATTTIDSNKHTGTYPSLSFDIDGNAYIAYYRRSGGSLRLASMNRDSGDWSIITVDDSADVGVYASLDIGEAALRSGFFTRYDTTIAIAYADITNGYLKYSRLDIDDPQATWFTSVVDDLDYIGSIDLNLHENVDGLGLQAQIAYIDAGRGLVKYAYRANSAWSTEIVAGSGKRGGPVQLTFADDDSPIVAFFQGTKRAVYTSRRTGANAWSTTRIAPASGLISTALNDRTGDSMLTYLDRARSRIYTIDL